MKVVLLSAGYATRLYPLTKDYPKALLPIKGRPIVAYIIDKLEPLKEIEEIIIVTNDRFSQHFASWLKSYRSIKAIKLINDSTKSEDDRLGAVGDLSFAIEREKIADDLLVIAGDNLFSFDLEGLLRASENNSFVSVGIYEMRDCINIDKFGVVKMDKDNFITDFVEKPKIPFSKLIAVGIYFMPQNTLGFISEYLSLTNSSDTLGRFIEWLIQKDRVLGYRFRGVWYDIGDAATYEEAKLNFNSVVGGTSG